MSSSCAIQASIWARCSTWGPNISPDDHGIFAADIGAQHPRIDPLHPGAAIVPRAADGPGFFLFRIEPLADDRHVGVGVGDGEHDPRRPFLDLRVARGVGTGQFTLGGRLVQHRPGVVGVAGDEHGAVAAPQRRKVEDRNPVRVQLDARHLQIQAVQRRRPAGGRKHMFEHRAPGAALLRPPGHLHVAGARPFSFDLDAQVHGEFAPEALPRRRLHDGVGDAADHFALVEHRGAHAQPGEGDRQLDAQGAGPDHRQGFGQGVEVEHRFVGKDAVAARLGQGPGNRGPRAGGDDDRPRLDPGVVIHRQAGRPVETRLSRQLVLGGNGGHVLEDRGDEIVPLALDARHDGGPVDTDLGSRPDAELRRGAHVPSRRGRRPAEVWRACTRRAQVVPPGPASMRTVLAPASTAVR